MLMPAAYAKPIASAEELLERCRTEGSVAWFEI